MTVEETFTLDNVPNPSTIKRPSIIKEVQGMWQPLRLLGQYRSLTKNKIGNGERVILFPGWKSHQTIMFPVKQFLKKLGYTPEYWGLGLNNGYVERYRNQIMDKLKKEDSDEKIILIGWSLGGLIAREVAREMPEKVASIITYGTPVIGGPLYTIGAKYYGEEMTQEIAEKVTHLDATNPIQTPISAVFTKNDSIVAWSACIDKVSPNVKHYEVNSTHLSLGIDPNVWRVIVHHMEEYH